MKKWIHSYRLIWIIGGIFLGRASLALPYSYPAVRYISPLGHSLGGMTLPLSAETGNALFNNPAALSRNTKFRAEALNLNFDLNSSILGSLSTSTGFSSLGGFTSSLNSNVNRIFSGGLGNLTAVSWGGLAVGLLLQERVRAYSDGTTVNYETTSNLVPAVGYGLALARGVVRVGYSLQLVSQASGVAQAPSNSSAAYLSGISEGKGLSHTASVNFVFPYTYTPTVSLLARNLFGMRYFSRGLIPRASSPIGTPASEPMSIDAALDFTARLSGPIKSNWYIQFKDLTSATSLALLDKLSFGIDLGISQPVSIRLGLNHFQFSGGIGYRSEFSEINLAYYQELTPFPAISKWDTRYALQYKVFIQDKNSRDRETENQSK
ncbi:MAG: hypothetical protein KGP28_02670 [Bdellovibrionales bacterium]|nr:hypothetical protein [Bdellovibrionales bacterium]